MKKQSETTEKTRQSFIDIFCELYTQKPIEKISIREISNKSGYNRSTFYQYFNDIYDLLAYIENDVLNYIQKILQSKKCKANPSDVQSIVCLFEEKWKYLEALLGDYGTIRFLERLKKEIPSDELNLSFEKDIPILPYLMEFNISTSISLFRLWQRRQKDLPLEELFDLVQNLYNTGITSYSL
ncbi:TetR/AcrR family transcriptional regulator [uncultured Clostridium sp.]|uniref:TetR/AcrR family transcriptional regulator n=1 Tax=uncultured Clostridium sp. TaxID=59620 RepID=UPI0028E8F6C5|nr:TetR/AcrR family transcriptional regulator [uncultured Clostridium sp.]